MRSLLVFLLLSSNFSWAQSTILDAYVEEGIANNLSLKQQNLELEKAIKGIEVAKSNYFPRLNFAPTYSVAFGGRKIEIPIGDLLNPVYTTLNQLTASNAFPQVENASEQLAPMNFHDTKMEFKMPLFNSDIKYNVALQKDLLNSEQAKKKFLEFELRHEIEKAYYQYLQTLDAIRIFEGSVEVFQSYVELNRSLVKHKEKLKDVLVSAEYELSKVQQLKEEALKNKTVAGAYFNFLINKPLDSEIVVDTSFRSILPQLKPLAGYSENAIRNRPEFEQANAGLKTNQTLLKMQQKNAILPQAFIGSNFGFQGYGYSFQDQAYLVGQVGLNWQIFNAGEKKTKIAQTKISNQQIQTKIEEMEKQVEMQVFQNYRELETILKTLESKRLDEQRTTTVFELVNSRYRNGDAIFLEVNQAENDVLISKLEHSIARLRAWLKFSDLRKASGY